MGAKMTRETLTCSRCGPQFTAILGPGETIKPMGACKCGEPFIWNTEPYTPVSLVRIAITVFCIVAAIGLVLLVDYLVRVQPFPAG